MTRTEMGRGNEAGKETTGRDNGMEYEEEWMRKETRSCWSEDHSAKRPNKKKESGRQMFVAK
jgi:hypothetical protein